MFSGGSPIDYEQSGPTSTPILDQSIEPRF